MLHFIAKHVILSLLMIWLIEAYIDLDLPEVGFVFVPLLAMFGVEWGYRKLFPKADHFPWRASEIAGRERKNGLFQPITDSVDD